VYDIYLHGIIASGLTPHIGEFWVPRVKIIGVSINKKFHENILAIIKQTIKNSDIRFYQSISSVLYSKTRDFGAHR
jgi:hypothetical protein